MADRTLDASELRLAPDHVLLRIQRGALIAGTIAAVCAAVGALVSPGAFFRAYLPAYLFWLGIALGCLAILMVQYLTGGAWGAVVRRILESATRTLPMMAILFVPLAFGLAHLYEWARPEALHDPVLRHKSIYLNAPFFIVRAIVYFAAWITVARFLNRWSLEQDQAPDPTLSRRLEMLSRGGLMIYGFTITFAAVDWGMSLTPHWFSTIYGVIFMGGQGLSAFAFAIPVAALLAERAPFAHIIGREQFHDLGKLMLAFVMLWAYFNVSQLVIVWSGNLPEEIPWYLQRAHGGWRWVSVALVALHFAVPFVVLLSRDVKRHARALATVALVLIAARLLDLFWLLRPGLEPAEAAVSWLDFVTPVAIGGIWIWAFVAQLKERPLIPLNDPSLPEHA